MRVAVVEDAAVGGHQPVALAVGGGRHAHDGLVERQVAGRPVEGGVAVVEDPAVGGHQPVALAVRGGRHAHDGLVQRHAAGRTGKGRSALAEDAAVGGHEPVAESLGRRVGLARGSAAGWATQNRRRSRLEQREAERQSDQTRDRNEQEAASTLRGNVIPPGVILDARTAARLPPRVHLSSRSDHRAHCPSRSASPEALHLPATCQEDTRNRTTSAHRSNAMAMCFETTGGPIAAPSGSATGISRLVATAEASCRSKRRVPVRRESSYDARRRRAR